MKNKVKVFHKKTLLLLSLLFTASIFVSCVDDELFRDDLPDANSKEDTVPPSANFSYASDQEDFRIVHFTNLSNESNAYSWDFGGGATSDQKDPTYKFDAGEGSYPVSLTASDSNNESSTITIDVAVVDELVPFFVCPSFECSPRTPWAGDGGETSTFTGSSGPTPPDGSTGAKISSSSQWLDQTILVSPDTTYEIIFWYVSTPGSTNGGSLLIQDADSGQNFKDEDLPASATSGQYYEISYQFTTAATTEHLRFRMDYGGFECRYDLISIER